MANDCLVKRLKGVVDNSDLKYYGAVEFNIKHMDNPDQYAHNLSITDPVFRVLGSGTVTVDGTAYNENSGVVSLTGTKQLDCSNADFKLVLFNRYDVKGEVVAVAVDRDNFHNRGIELDVSQYNYADNLYVFACNGMYLTGKFTNFRNLGYFIAFNQRLNDSIPFANLEIDSSDIAENTVLEAFNYEYISDYRYNLSASDVKINLAHFENKLNFRQLLTPWVNGVGDIKTFAIAQVTNGRTDGELVFAVLGTNILLGGFSTDSAELKERYNLNNNCYRIRVTYNSSLSGGYKISLLDGKNWVDITV